MKRCHGLLGKAIGQFLAVQDSSRSMDWKRPSLHCVHPPTHLMYEIHAKSTVDIEQCREDMAKARRRGGIVP